MRPLSTTGGSLRVPDSHISVDRHGERSRTVGIVRKEGIEVVRKIAILVASVHSSVMSAISGRLLMAGLILR